MQTNHPVAGPERDAASATAAAHPEEMKGTVTLQRGNFCVYNCLGADNARGLGLRCPARTVTFDPLADSSASKAVG